MSDQVSPNRMNLLNLRTRIASAVMEKVLNIASVESHLRRIGNIEEV